MYPTKAATGTLTLFEHTAKVQFAQASVVYDPDGSMFDAETNTVTLTLTLTLTITIN